jgi:ankyrin repeat protein
MSSGAGSLIEACCAGEVEAVRRLLRAGADKNRALVAAATSCLRQNGDIEIVRLLVEAGADTNQAFAGGCTPLYIASQQGNIELERLLVEAAQTRRNR